MILGIDASTYLDELSHGAKYFDGDRQIDPLDAFRANGVDCMRIRVWNDPHSPAGESYLAGDCDMDHYICLGKLAKAKGYRLLLDFHYSDFWADPAKQMAPKAWKDMDIDTKSQALYEYTKSCLEQLRDAGVEIGMVQVGNETNGVMCGEDASALGGWKKITQLMSAGSKAVREVCPDALVVIHFANPEKVTNYESYGKNLEYYGVDYDVFASSYYPFLARHFGKSFFRA